MKVNTLKHEFWPGPPTPPRKMPMALQSKAKSHSLVANWLESSVTFYKRSHWLVHSPKHRTFLKLVCLAQIWFNVFFVLFFFSLVQLYCTLLYQRYKWMLLWRWVKQFKGRVQLWKLQLLNKIMKSHLNWRVSLNWLLKKILVDNKFTLNNRIQQTKFQHYCVNKYRK